MMYRYEEFDITDTDAIVDDRLLELRSHNSKATQVRNKVERLVSKGLFLPVPYELPAESQLREMFTGAVKVSVSQIQEHGLKMPKINIEGPSHSIREDANLGFVLHFDDMGNIDESSRVRVINYSHLRAGLGESFGNLDEEKRMADGRTESEVWKTSIVDIPRGPLGLPQTQFPLAGSDIVFLDQLISDVYLS